MPYLHNIQSASASAKTREVLLREVEALRAELDDYRTKFAALLAKLDADGGVTDTNYAATVGLAAARFTKI